jgi:ribosomal protein S18 acetylase RimI-like enzyme
MVGGSLSICIRRATSDDLETLHDLETECFTTDAFTKDQLTYLLETPKGISLVVTIDNEIAGFIMGLILNHGEARTGHVYTLDVAVKHRRRGVGLRLLKALERTFADHGVAVCYLETRRGNVAALELYRKHGYIEVGVLESFYADAVDGVRLMKTLSR